jgi:hypothetical protein
MHEKRRLEAEVKPSTTIDPVNPGNPVSSSARPGLPSGWFPLRSCGLACYAIFGGFFPCGRSNPVQVSQTSHPCFFLSSVFIALVAGKSVPISAPLRLSGGFFSGLPPGCPFATHLAGIKANQAC